MCSVTANECTRDTQTNPLTEFQPTELDDPRLELFKPTGIAVNDVTVTKYSCLEGDGLFRDARERVDALNVR